MLTVKCPRCKKETAYSPDNTYRPFCSERCRLIDFGDWASEKYAIPALEKNEDSTENDIDKNQKDSE